MSSDFDNIPDNERWGPTRKLVQDLAKKHGTSLRDERWKICKSCDELTGHLGGVDMKYFCDECGCFLPMKISFSWMECPLGKW